MEKVASERGLTRRQLLTAGGAAALGAATLLVGERLVGAPQTKAVTAEKVKYGMVIDLGRCFGCRACMVACKVENNTPEAVFWMYVFRFEVGKYPNVKISYLPRPCMHCDNAPCVEVCPVGARFKREDGLVVNDLDRCIGCRYCHVSCPYGVNYFNWKDPKKNQYLDWEKVDWEKATLPVAKGVIPPYQNPDLKLKYEGKRVAGGGHFKGVVGKCTFCVHRLGKGLLPACVANCPVEALHFGNLDDPESPVSKLLKRKPAFRLAEEYGTEPRVYYVGAPPPRLDARQLDPIVRRA